MRAALLAPIALLTLACRTGDKSVEGAQAGLTDTGSVDADADGFPASEDCDDGDPSVNGGATEVCDGVDNDCDGEVDEDVTTIGFEDTDADGFGDPDAPVEACTLPDDAVANANDCDDTDPAVFPGAIEVCNGIDDDCDDDVDEELLVEVFTDTDGDGWGDPGTGTLACEAGSGEVLDGSDCDDARPEAFPGAEEACNELDDDCDGDIDEGVTTTFWLDGDGDGYGETGGVTTEACETPLGYADAEGDCDEADIAFHPGAPETDCADPADYNCDGSVAYADTDGDGWAACEECDDGDAAVHPAATEVCDGIDNDCDGDTDDDDAGLDASTADTWYADADTDTYGDAATTTLACDQPAGFVADATDCDDGATAVHPAATEICDGIDNDCDGDIDDADASLDLSSATTWYADSDGDTYGDASSTSRACTQPSGTVANDGDCDDGDAAIQPLAAEVCDGIDNDCDGDTDDADVDITGQSTWYTDGDGDGYGGSSSALACTQPAGTTASSTDCDDGAAAINPGATEVCDSLDNDCDGLVDDDDSSVSGTSTWYVDSDGDGYGSSSTVQSCAQPAGSATNASDCNDSAVAVNPGAAEVCNHTDDDCDGSVDEGHDADGDGIVDCDEITYTVTWSATGDDVWQAYIDGTFQSTYSGWSTVNTMTTTLDSGDHVLSGYAYDTGAAIAGFLGAVYVDGSLTSVTGDGSWKVTRSPGSGWTDVSYSSAAWSTASRCSSSQVSSYWGSTPSSLRGVSANWIWYTTNCTALNSAYFRYEFTLP